MKKIILLTVFLFSCFFLFSPKDTHALSADFGGLYYYVQNPWGQRIGGATVSTWGNAGAEPYNLLAANGGWITDGSWHAGLPALSCRNASFINFYNGGNNVWGVHRSTGATDGNGFRRVSAHYLAYTQGVWGFVCYCDNFDTSITHPNYYSWQQGGGGYGFANNWDYGYTITLTPIPPPTCTITVDRNPISAGTDSTTVRWNSHGAVTSAKDINGAPVSPSGTAVVSPESTTTYGLRPTGPGGTGPLCSVTLNVRPKPTCTLSDGRPRLAHWISGTSVSNNANLWSGYEMTTSWIGDSNTSLIKWTLSKDNQCIWGYYRDGYNQAACNDSAAWSPNTRNDGPMPQWRLEPGVYWSTLRMHNGLPGGDTTCVRGPFNVTSCPAPDLPPLIINPSTIEQGQSTTITYAPSGADWCWIWAKDSAGNDIAGTGEWCNATNGSHTVTYTPATPRTYHVKIGKSGCSETEETIPIIVNVSNACPSLSANPGSIASGDTSSLSWGGGNNVSSISLLQRPEGVVDPVTFLSNVNINGGSVTVTPPETTIYYLDVVYNGSPETHRCPVAGVTVTVQGDQSGNDTTVPPN